MMFLTKKMIILLGAKVVGFRARGDENTYLFQIQAISLYLDFLMLVPHSPLYKEWWNLLFPRSGWKNKLHSQKKREQNKTTLWVNELELDLTMEHFGFNLAQSKYWGCTGSLSVLLHSRKPVVENPPHFANIEVGCQRQFMVLSGWEEGSFYPFELT